ncbi:carbohydrate-binding protein [Actinospica sp. MGRD01-02]|uniref:Carbohydrate-binding protein n=1 Tax=Actinospica acidithermotolerans TaxID=2828514 RepID=A0A941E7B2_9ACTN|nr:carbohydrate-binding protein [Actinospica acidithermotolerans]MBR7825127.1 carbohydrate-binding protein [Actinospica acidithermotolerans]
MLSAASYGNADFTRMPFVGNGYLAQRLPAIGEGFQGALGPSGYQLDQIPKQRMTTSIVAGVYNKGLSSSVPGTEYIASLPTWSTMDLGVGGQTLDASTAASQISDYRQSVDMLHGVVSTSLTWTPQAGDATAVSFQVLANQAQMHLGEVQVSVTPSWSGDLSLSALLDGSSAQGINPTSRAVDTRAHTSSVSLETPGADNVVDEVQHLVAGPGVSVTSSTADQPTANTATAGEDWTVPVQAGHTYVVTKYVGIATSNDTRDPSALAATTAVNAAHTGWNALLRQHEAAWAALWAPNVRVAGDETLQAATNMSYYTLYSSIRAGLSWSIPPAGLTSQDYNGDIFWDADTWMFPTLLALHPELAKSIVMFRYDTISQAEANAKANGYQGGVWSWDNGPDGVCGDLGHPMCVGFEDHLEGDIALAQWQYYEATGDTAWLRRYGYPVLKDIAEFWASRVTLGSDGLYHINGVTGPDEYTAGVNDESATNAGAIVALRDATTAAKLVGATADPAWSAIADKINIVTSADGTHAEYAGYTNETAKQADTVLMTYPFQYVTASATAAADLDRYMPVTDPNGPAMTASVESIIAAQVQQPGCLDYTLFENSYQPYLNGPYDQFAETQGAPALTGTGTGPAFDFATGAGGFLQTYVYGYAGLRWSTSALELAPTLPPQLKSGITISGLRYQGRSVTIAIGPKQTVVTLTDGAAVTVQSPRGTTKLTQGRPVVLPTARPDLDATDDLARCQNVVASSSQLNESPTAAVDGNSVTTWTAASTTSSYTVTLARQSSTGNAHITWGTTRPASYAVSVRSAAGSWQQVAIGQVPATGDLDMRWATVAGTAVRFDFGGGSAASIRDLTIPDASAADLVGSLSGAPATAPGASISETLTLKNPSDVEARDVTSDLAVPQGWTVTADPASVDIAAGASATVTWTVTPPASQSATTATLTATTSWQGVAARDATTATTSLDVIQPKALGATMQAEDGALGGGASVDGNHNGYTGTGFVDNWYEGASDTFLVTVPTAGVYPVSVRYANSLGGQAPPLQNITRTTSLTTGSLTAPTTQQLQLPVTGSWDTWGTVTEQVALPAGTDLIQLSVGPDDDGSVNIDSIAVG